MRTKTNAYIFITLISKECALDIRVMKSSSFDMIYVQFEVEIKQVVQMLQIMPVISYTDFAMCMHLDISYRLSTEIRQKHIVSTR